MKIAQNLARSSLGKYAKCFFFQFFNSTWNCNSFKFWREMQVGRIPRIFYLRFGMKDQVNDANVSKIQPPKRITGEVNQETVFWEHFWVMKFLESSISSYRTNLQKSTLGYLGIRIERFEYGLNWIQTANHKNFRRARRASNTSNLINGLISTLTKRKVFEVWHSNFD